MTRAELAFSALDRNKKVRCHFCHFPPLLHLRYLHLFGLHFNPDVPTDIFSPGVHHHQGPGQADQEAQPGGGRRPDDKAGH